jgi:hypothetical protein
MSGKINKSSLEEAKLNFEEIKNFAQEEIKKELQQETEKKVASILEKLVNEDVSVTINADGNNVEVQVGEEGNVEVSKDGEHVASVDSENSVEDSEAPIDEPISVTDDEEVTLTDDDMTDEELDEVMQNQNMNEMDNIKMEQEQVPATPAPAADATAAPAPDAAPAADATAAPEGGDAQMSELISKIDTLINVMLQQQGGEAPEGADAAGQQVDVIDDEAGAAPAPAAGAPAPAVQEEEMTFEIVDDTKDIEIINDIENECVMGENPGEEGPAMEETRSLGFTSKRTGDKTLKMDTMEKNKGHHAPVTSLKENKDTKAQYESIIDELKKENAGLKGKVAKLESERKEFEEGFVVLREQFDEMQTFNGKLYLVNKLLTLGGLTQEEKTKICEKFDAAKTIKEAEALFKTVIKENKSKFSGNEVDNKIKATTTNTTKAKSVSQPLYESDEARRMKMLAGIGKGTEEEN